MAKYNQLLRIEEELGVSTIYSYKKVYMKQFLNLKYIEAIFLFERRLFIFVKSKRNQDEQISQLIAFNIDKKD